MQTPEFWWAIGIGSVSLAVAAAVYVFSIALNQRRFIKEQRRQLEIILESERRYRNLSAHLQSVREEERVRIAREIHDELGQVLTVAKLYLSVLLDGIKSGQSTSAEAISKSVESITSIVDDSITLVKGIAYQLRPMILDELGLKEALEWECAEFQKRTGIACRMDITEEFDLGREESAAVFRILQEALTNVARHAHATAVDVEAKAAGKTLSLHVRDNGRGITAGDGQNPKSLGIVGMKERAIFLGGRLEVTGGSNGGADVFLEVPIKGDV